MKWKQHIRNTRENLSNKKEIHSATAKKRQCPGSWALYCKCTGLPFITVYVEAKWATWEYHGNILPYLKPEKYSIHQPKQKNRGKKHRRERTKERTKERKEAVKQRIMADARHSIMMNRTWKKWCQLVTNPRKVYYEYGTCKMVKKLCYRKTTMYDMSL